MSKLTRIHVNQHNIKYNRKWPTFVENNGARPVITVKDYKQNRKGFEAAIVDNMGPGSAQRVIAKVVYRPEKPLACGAVCWIETKEEVIVQ